MTRFQKPPKLLPFSYDYETARSPKVRKALLGPGRLAEFLLNCAEEQMERADRGPELIEYAFESIRSLSITVAAHESPSPPDSHAPFSYIGSVGLAYLERSGNEVQMSIQTPAQGQHQATYTGMVFYGRQRQGDVVWLPDKVWGLGVAGKPANTQSFPQSQIEAPYYPGTAADVMDQPVARAGLIMYEGVDAMQYLPGRIGPGLGVKITGGRL